MAIPKEGSKEYKRAMEEMECWSVLSHLDKCKKCRQEAEMIIMDKKINKGA